MLGVTHLVGFGAGIGQAFPIVETTATSVEVSDITSHTVNYPTGISSGDLLIAIFTADSNPVITFPGGWTTFFNKVEAGTSNTRTAAAWLDAAGTETGTFTVTTSTAQASAHNVYRISGAANPSTQPPEGSSGASGLSSTPNPDSLTPTGGTKKYLWIALAGGDGASLDPLTAGPSGYSGFIENGSGASGDSTLGSAWLQNEAASEDPGTFTATGSDRWVAGTIAVHPA